MFSVSVLLATLSPLAIPTPTTAAVRGGAVLTSYDDAYNRAGQEGKPILVLFAKQSQPSELQTLKAQGLMNDFLVVVADRNTEAGRKVCSQFAWNGDEGLAVIERTRQWQFARYERKLSGDELTRVAAASRGATGYPTADVLAGDVSAYPPPAQVQGPQAAQVIQPIVPVSYPQVQPVQFQPMPMPMFGGFGGGGCAGGH